MIYLASPYSDKDPDVMEARFHAVCRFAGRLMREGQVVYSPIAHCHPIAVRVELPRDWGFWQKFDREMIAKADELWILRLPGWDSSRGVAAERQIALDLGLNVVEVDP
jgi:hypothetical protein